MKKYYDVEEKVPLLQGIPLSLQHLFAMFGSTVLVPFFIKSKSGHGFIYEWCRHYLIPCYL